MCKASSSAFSGIVRLLTEGGVEVAKGKQGDPRYGLKKIEALSAKEGKRVKGERDTTEPSEHYSQLENQSRRW